MNRYLLIALGLLVVLTACTEPSMEADNQATTSVPTNWLGRWNGPEGTWLLLAENTGMYDLTIADLDGPRRYQGVVRDGQLYFERNGVEETLHATDGVATGMKWLSEKMDCLTVRPGEGYCRD